MKSLAERKDAKGDPVVLAVLDAVFQVKGWDYESVFPESVLGKDLEFNQDEIAQFAEVLRRNLSTRISLNFSKWNSFSLRQIVAQIHEATLKAG